jgi:hypothetical protein
MSSSQDPSAESWEAYFGPVANLELPNVGLDLSCTVAERYYFSAVRGIVKKAKGDFTAATLKEFCAEAAQKWYERHRNDKAPAGKETLQRIRRLVPEAEGRPYRRLEASLEGACRDEALARLLLRRYGSGAPRMKALALREAFLEHANETLGLP